LGDLCGIAADRAVRCGPARRSRRSLASCRQHAAVAGWRDRAAWRPSNGGEGWRIGRTSRQNLKSARRTIGPPPAWSARSKAT